MYDTSSSLPAGLPRLVRILKFVHDKFSYYTFKSVYYKGTDQTAYSQAGLYLCCSKTVKPGFIVSRSICNLQ